MANDLAHQVAETIFASAQSGSAVWDEVGSPDATWHAEGDRQVIEIPAEFDEETGERKPGLACRITVEMVAEDPLAEYQAASNEFHYAGQREKEAHADEQGH